MEKLKYMFKKINKFSKLAFLFTVFYILIGKLIMLNAYDVYMSADWIPKFIYKSLSLSHILLIPTYLSTITSILYEGGMLVAIVLGVLAIIKTNKIEEKGKEKWIIVLLTIFNLFVFVLNIMAMIIYPLKF